MSKDRTLTKHVGSLPRPAALLAPMQDKFAGRDHDAAALEGTSRDSVRDIVARQVEIGIDVVSDGEFSKPSHAPMSASG